MSTVNIGRESLAEWSSGHGTVDQTPVQLFAGVFEVRKYVIVRANAANTGTISLGNSAIRADAGFILAAGETSPKIYIDDLSKVWLIGSADSQNYSWLSV